MTESIEFEGLVWFNQLNWLKIPQKRSTKSNFSKKSQQNRLFEKGQRNRLPKTSTCILSWLIDSIELFESFFLFGWVDSKVLSNMLELIGIFKLYRFVVIELIHFHILPRLKWLIWHESYVSLSGWQNCKHDFLQSAYLAVQLVGWVFATVIWFLAWGSNAQSMRSGLLIFLHPWSWVLRCYYERSAKRGAKFFLI